MIGDELAEVARGTTGEILIRGGNVMQATFTSPKKPPRPSRLTAGFGPAILAIWTKTGSSL